MKIKNIILTSLFAVGCISASAQQEVKKEEVFLPHWYGGAQVGMQHTLGEVDWSDLNSLNGQLSLGYQFSPVWGARVVLNGWQSKGGSVINPGGNLPNHEYQWSWNYIAPTVDVTYSLTNALCGFNPDRRLDLSIFAGVGVNLAWGNDDAVAANAAMRKDYVNVTNIDKSAFLRKLWEDNKVLPVLQWGANLDYNLTRNLSLGVEFGCNIVGDSYNSKKAENVDWYFNTLAGLKYRFGETTKVRYTTLEPPCTNTVEYVHDTIYVNVEVPVAPKKETLRRDIFFVLRGTKIDASEMPKIGELVAYLYQYPEAKVAITGYADRGTGNPKVNVGYAEKRANIVAQTLAEQFGIDRSRMIIDSKGDTEQPFSENDRNRVSICIAE